MNIFLGLWIVFALLALIAGLASLHVTWHRRSRKAWVLSVVAILAWLAIWITIEQEVRLASFYRQEAALYFALAVGIPVLAGALVARIARADIITARRAAVVVAVACWIFLAMLLGFGLACNINRRCDM